MCMHACVYACVCGCVGGGECNTELEYIWNIITHYSGTCFSSNLCTTCMTTWESPKLWCHNLCTFIPNSDGRRITGKGGGGMLSHVSHTNELCDNSQALDKIWSSNIQTIPQFPESILECLASVVIVHSAYKPCRFALFMWSSCFKSILCMVLWTQHSLIVYSMGRGWGKLFVDVPFQETV